MRHQGNYEEVFPFHLKGQYSIDFSKEEKLNEPIYRIYEKPLYHVEPLGEPPSLEPRIPSRDLISNIQTQPEPPEAEVNFSDLDLPNLKQITDRDINIFMKESFNKIIHLFKSLFDKVKANSPEFDFTQDNIHGQKAIFKIYVNGKNVTSIKIWHGNFFGGNTINLSFGSYINPSNNSANQVITHHVVDKKQLKLKMTMNIYRNRDAATHEEIVKEIWKNQIVHTLER